jgi:hypothetical protein
MSVGLSFRSKSRRDTFIAHTHGIRRMASRTFLLNFVVNSEWVNKEILMLLFAIILSCILKQIMIKRNMLDILNLITVHTMSTHSIWPMSTHAR